MSIFALFVIFCIFYFIPTIIAINRKHSQAAPIGAVNVLLGWTFLGWVVALVWSLSSERAPLVLQQSFSQQLPPQTVAPDLQQTCPHCFSSIPAQATVCRYCQRDLAQHKVAHEARPSSPIPPQLPPGGAV